LQTDLVRLKVEESETDWDSLQEWQLELDLARGSRTVKEAV
jgi:hypothetical protein